MPRRKKVKAVVYLYEEQIKRLRKISVKKDEPVSKLIRDAVAEYLLKN
jgi:hypothetical protein